MSKLFRFKCPQCGRVQDAPGDKACWKCHTMVSLPQDGIIQIYRMPACLGIGCSMEIYINNIRLGCLKYGDSIRIPVQYGHYHVLMKFLDYKLSKYKGFGTGFCGRDATALTNAELGKYNLRRIEIAQIY